MLRLEFLRKEKKLSQKELSKMVNLTQQRISAYEKGKREPDLETLSALANFFNVTIDYLLGNSNIRNVGEMKNEIYSSNNFETAELLKYYKKLNRFRKRKSFGKCEGFIRDAKIY